MQESNNVIGKVHGIQGIKGLRFMREELRLSFLVNLSSKRLRIIEGYTPKGRLLDVGAAIGVFVGTAQELGWMAKGLELSKFNCQCGRDRLGVELINTSFETYQTNTSTSSLRMSYMSILKDVDLRFWGIGSHPRARAGWRSMQRRGKTYRRLR